MDPDGETEISEILITKSGTNLYITEYGNVASDTSLSTISAATFSAGIGTGAAITVTPATSGNYIVKISGIAYDFA
jgi:hypothetical protein